MIMGNDLERTLQTASIDCPLGRKAYRVSASGLPRAGEPVSALLQEPLYEWDLKEGSLLERGATYIIPLAMDLSLSSGLYGEFSPKSTTGRNDVFVHVLCDGQSRFDIAPRGYSGPLYLEVTPLSYPVQVSPRLSLTQLRVKDEEVHLSNKEIELLHAKHGIVRDGTGTPLPHKALKVQQNGIFLHVDLSTSVVGLESLATPEQKVNLAEKDAHDPKEFWRPVRVSRDGSCVLEPGKFYLLKTKEQVLVPPECCAWMQPYDVASGEFRSHYAGFFDNGFGDKKGTVGVLEVRVHDVPFRIRDGSPICRFVFEKTDEVPELLYGSDLGSTYTESGPSLAKNFKDRYRAWDDSYWRS
jgi:dCTP deaminase